MQPNNQWLVDSGYRMGIESGYIILSGMIRDTFIC